MAHRARQAAGGRGPREETHLPQARRTKSVAVRRWLYSAILGSRDSASFTFSPG